MSNLVALKNKVKSLTGTGKITGAMEMVAATKMRRAVIAATSTREYAIMAGGILGYLSESEKIDHPFFLEKKEKKVLLIVIGSNRGLCGGYNFSVESKVRQYIEENKEMEIDIIAIGRKAAIFIRRLEQNLIAVYEDMPDTLTMQYIRPIMDFATKKFVNGSYDKVSVVYTRFKSSLSQEVKISKIFPITKEIIENFREQLTINNEQTVDEENNIEYTFEPGKEEVIEYAAKMIAESQMYQAFLESLASEHSSRMVTMKNATETAGDMVSDMTREFNKKRQGDITQEIAEISNTSELVS